MEILDASALLAFIKKEKGGESINRLFTQAYKEKFSVFIHQVNYIEVTKKLLKYFGEHETKKSLADLQQPFFGVSNFMDDRLATYTSWITSNYQNTSLADAIGLSFTKVMEGRFWTADSPLQAIAKKEKINLKLIRE